MYACPIGFDCQLESSCPSFTVDCPKGFFCSSYLDSKHLKELDDSYDLISKIYSDDPPKVDSDRAFQIQCLPGFYCPNATTILVRTRIFAFIYGNSFSSLVHLVIGALAKPINQINAISYRIVENEPVFK